jgi:queuine tRNA-ribosyltransferase accessory subunit
MKRSSSDRPEQPSSSSSTNEAHDVEEAKFPIRLLLHTSDGIIPYLTPALLQKYLPAPQNHLSLGIAVRDTCSKPLFPSKESTKPNGYAFFPTVVDKTVLDYHRITVPSFDLLQDSVGKPAVTSHAQQIMLWTPHGRQPLTPAVYKHVAKSLQSHATLSMYDMALDSDSRRRQDSAAKRTLGWWQDLASEEEDTTVLAPIVLIGTPQAPPTTIIAGAAAGYVLVGLDHISSRHERNERISIALKACDPTKTKIALSCTSVRQMIDMIRLGVDTVGTALPTAWSQSRRAFACDVTHRPDNTKRSRTTDNDHPLLLDGDGCLDLGNAAYCRDARPLVEGCNCFTCQHHSRAYIHHLVQANELLAQILLFAHNVARVLELCQQATTAQQENRLDDFCDMVEHQLLEAVDAADVDAGLNAD